MAHKTKMCHYRFIKLIGKGSFGRVALAVHKLTGREVAVKIFDKSFLKDDYRRRRVCQETYIMKKLDHEGVTKVIEACETPSHLMLVMEYVPGGDLLNLVKAQGKVAEKEAKHIFQ